MSKKDDDFLRLALKIVACVAGAFFIGWVIYQIVQFYETHRAWFWLIIALIIISPICYFLRFKIMEMFYHIFNRKKPDTADEDRERNNK